MCKTILVWLLTIIIKAPISLYIPDTLRYCRTARALKTRVNLLVYLLCVIQTAGVIALVEEAWRL